MKVINVPTIILQKLNANGSFIVVLPNRDGSSPTFVTVPASRILTIYKHNIAFLNYDGLIPYNYMGYSHLDDKNYGYVIVNVQNVEMHPWGNIFAVPYPSGLNYKEIQFLQQEACNAINEAFQRNGYRHSMSLSTSLDALPKASLENYLSNMTKEEMEDLKNTIENNDDDEPMLAAHSTPVKFIEVVERVNPGLVKEWNKLAAPFSSNPNPDDTSFEA